MNNWLIGSIAAPAPPLIGGEVYQHLSNYLKLHLEKIRKESEQYMDESLLQYYTKQWTRYTAAARVVNNIFMYLNRYWVKREIDEDRKSDVYDVFTVMLSYTPCSSAEYWHFVVM